MSFGILTSHDLAAAGYPKVRLSSFTNPNGERVHQVLYCGGPITPETTYEQARARAILETPRGGKLICWDGDNGREWIEQL